MQCGFDAISSSLAQWVMWTGTWQTVSAKAVEKRACALLAVDEQR
jgi:hypothetical protein